jgi:hypothetical protein
LIPEYVSHLTLSARPHAGKPRQWSILILALACPKISLLGPLSVSPTQGKEPDFLLYCEEVGVENYRVLLSKLEAENHGKVAEPAAPYFVSRAEKVTQRRLFD